ncbi:Astacin-like metalloendopeptidase [Strongyloides ratti]|uniref:Metalloendopeptidase n=1 Tax=Strongyloides ratti TaxID=34506 RepID=A0A090LQL3_STRRB|nr:Astacin-like metalloendopeptidase [Strongyloides ratti]CEF69861.1 Astacin-like metalloendopeptidase [Strongyloides ratti]
MKFFLFITFFIFIVKSLSINNQENDNFESLVDNTKVIVKRVPGNILNDSSEKFYNIISRKKRYVNVYRVRPWTKLIPYYVDKGVDRGLVFNILKNIELETCLRFKSVDKKSRRNVPLIYKFIKTCSYPKSNRFIHNYVDPKCQTVGYSYRETLHMLGLVYEHQRRHRDKYVFINYKVIDRKSKKYFDRVVVSAMDRDEYGYDYGSVMHPDEHFLATKNVITLLPANFLFRRTIGQDVYPSFLDFKKINKYYCSKECKQKIKCQFGGYQHPEVCVICKCVFGHVGPFCERFNKPSRRCPTPIIAATGTRKILHAMGYKDCAYLLKASTGKRIGLQVHSGRIFPLSQPFCSPDNTLEIKHLADKLPTGVRFCGELAKTNMISQTNIVYIYYKSRNANSKFVLTFKEF